MSVINMQSPRTIAVFDFDNTLVKGDSLWPFLVAVAGLPRCIFVLLMGLVKWLRALPKGGDHRTLIKDYLLRKILSGRRATDLKPAITQIKNWPKWLETLKTLIEHHAAGDHILIASGSLDLYLHELLENVPCDGLICTNMEIIDGVVTGVMSSGNCVRERKAELISEYLKTHGPFDASWGYGNYPHDMPMLSLMQNKIIV